MNWLTIFLLSTGGFFILIAGIGLFRMPDIYLRMHAATKAGTLGVGLVLIALAVHSGDVDVTIRVILTILFLIVTAPVAAHMIGRAAHRTGVPQWSGTVIDEWKINDDARITPEAARPKTRGPEPTRSESR